jgi:molecular chaperone DnaK (HSP70)
MFDCFLIVEAAKNQAPHNPHNTISGVKCLIGRGFDDDEVKQELESFPFKVI